MEGEGEGEEEEAAGAEGEVEKEEGSGEEAKAEAEADVDVDVDAEVEVEEAADRNGRNRRQVIGRGSPFIVSLCFACFLSLSSLSVSSLLNKLPAVVFEFMIVFVFVFVFTVDIGALLGGLSIYFN